MMCWESTESPVEKEHHEEPEKMSNKLVETTEKQKHGEEHVGPTVNMSNRLKISIEEFSWENGDDESTSRTEELEPVQSVYITNLENGLEEYGTELNDKEGPDEKKPVAHSRPNEVPSLNNPNHEFDIYGETGSDEEYIEDFLKGRNKKNSKEYNYSKMYEEIAEKQADPPRQETTQYHHDIPKKKLKMRKLWPRRKWGWDSLKRTFS